MVLYGNLGGDSNVVSYEISNDSILVRFRDGGTYLYTSSSAGTANIAEMHRLARAGRGLNTFINREVRKRYAKKFS